ncbi:MAG TPA: polyprenol monophosphomannose synthase [Acidimicrobiales bacterium]|jgi:dolichol-phosphate mannosyltransferase|nr:polyprenol monophosphomannose synthase [Acidimicrobiales bacterium]
MLRPLIVLPTYNEAENIAEILRRVRAAVPQAGILVVDDSSPDGTGDIARAMAGEVGDLDILSRPRKSGLGSAYRDGFKWGRERGFEVLMEMDSDFSHDPADIPRLLKGIDEGADLVIGSRYVQGGAIPHWPWHRRALSKYGNRYSAAMLRLDVRDLTAGYRAYRTAIVERIDIDAVRAEGYGFQVEMTYFVAQAGGRIVEVPIKFVDRVRGTSKMSSAIVVEAMGLVTWWGIRDRVLRRQI